MPSAISIETWLEPFQKPLQKSLPDCLPVAQSEVSPVTMPFNVPSGMPEASLVRLAATSLMAAPDTFPGAPFPKSLSNISPAAIPNALSAVAVNTNTSLAGYADASPASSANNLSGALRNDSPLELPDISWATLQTNTSIVLPDKSLEALRNELTATSLEGSSVMLPDDVPVASLSAAPVTTPETPLDSAPDASLDAPPFTMFEASRNGISSRKANDLVQTVQIEGLHPSYFQTATKVLNILFRYRVEKSAKLATKSDEGALKFLAQIYSQAKAGQPVRMCLPAFPFKSPNNVSKVLGRLPDKAEEFALARLNSMCAEIGDIYGPGAQLTIVSDGLVYNDLLGVPDRDVWAYGQALRRLSVSKGFDHIAFSRLKDLVDVDVPDQLDEMTYVANASYFRYALLSEFSRPNFDASIKISEDEDTCLTYRGYIKFLSADLQYVYPAGEDRSNKKYKKGVEYIAKKMLARGDAFARAVRERYSSFVRLSIHPSKGENKISISLLPTETIYTTPWHCSIAFKLDGTVITKPRAEFDSDSDWELISENGRPSFYREKTELLTWDKEISCEPIYPSGLMIRPASGQWKMSMKQIDAAKVRTLAELNSPVVLRGFKGTGDRNLFVEKSYEFGTPTPWKFGLVLEVKDRGAETRGLNNVLSAEWMPFHYDGLFKTATRKKEDGTETLVSVPPGFQMFTAVTQAPKNTGYTLFASSTLIFKYMTSELKVDYLKSLSWAVSTSSFNSTVLRGLPLVVDHPTTGRPCLRYHEPWPHSKTKFDATNITIEGIDKIAGESLCQVLDEILHDRRVAYYHSWEKGDLLVSDNTLTMHTRSDFVAGCDRELWRIHFD